MNFTYRTATIEDRTYIMRLNFLADVFGDESKTPDSEESRDAAIFYVDAWQPGDGIVVVDEDVVNPAGGAWLIFGDDDRHGVGYVDPEIPELAIAVENRYQGHGLGTQLLRRAADQARERGCPGVSLCVHEDNPGARRLYEREGYELVPDAGERGYVVMVRRF